MLLLFWIILIAIAIASIFVMRQKIGGETIEQPLRPLDDVIREANLPALDD